MNIAKIQAKYAKKAPKQGHLNLGVTVTTLPNGDHQILIPASIQEEYVYESQTPDPKTGKPKLTPMAYCIVKSPDPKIARVVVPIKVIGADGSKVTVLFRMGGFSLFVNGVDESTIEAAPEPEVEPAPEG